MLGIPGTNDQGIGDDRYAGYPGVPHGLHSARQLRRLDADLPRRAHLLVHDQRDEDHGRHEFRGGYIVNYLWLNHWQPEIDNPRGRFDFTTRSITALHGGAQAANFYNPYAAFLLGLPGTVSKSVQVRGDDRPRVAARAVRPRPLDVNRQADARSRRALGVLPDHAAAPIAASSASTCRRWTCCSAAAAATRRTSGLEAAKDNFAPRLGARLPHERRHGASAPATASPTTRFRGRVRCAGSTR